MKKNKKDLLSNMQNNTYVSEWKAQAQEEEEKKPKGRKQGAQAFKKRKQAPSYKIVTIRFKEDEYNDLYNKILKKYKNDYSSLSDYIKSVIYKDLEK